MSAAVIQAAGGVVYSYAPDGSLHLLLIRDRHQAWTLPKGHLEPAEDEPTAARREIAEETGLPCVIEQLVVRVSYPVYRRHAWHPKEVAYFLARAAHLPPVPAVDEGISVATWVEPSLALRLLTYSQVRDVVRQALAVLEART